MRLGGPRCAAGVDSFENPCRMARKTHKGAKGVAGALARAQLATASLGNFDAMRRRSRRASAAPSSPRTATRPRASRASRPGSTTSPTATSARCCGRAVTTAAVATAPRLQMEDCAPRDSFGRAADVDVPSDSPLGWSKLAAFLAPRDFAAAADTWKTCSAQRAARTACCLVCWTAARAQGCFCVERVVGCEVRRRAAEEMLNE